MIKLKSALAAVALAALVSCGSDLDMPPAGEADLVVPGVEVDRYDPTKDVTMGKCRAGTFGDVTAPLTIKNSTDSPRAYTVSVEVVKGSEQVTTLDAFVNHLRAGQTTRISATGYLESTGAMSGSVCKILTITSYGAQ